MCVTIERQSTICGHVASYTELCAGKKNQSVLKIFCPKCVPSARRTSCYEICHDCRRFWQLYGVCESDAIQRTRAYRRENDYFGPLSPHSFGLAQPKLMRDIYLNSDNGNNPTAKLLADRARQVARSEAGRAEWLVCDGEQEIPAGDEEDLTEWLMKQAVGEASSSKRESSATELTVWPRVPDSEILRDNNKVKDKGKMKARAEDVPSDINSLTNIGEFEMGVVETNLQPGRLLEDPSYFEREALENQSQVKVDVYGFERQDLYMPVPYRPADILRSYEGAGGQGPTAATLVKAPPDLNKPLPPPPRRDSPVPGRPFNSENP